MKRFHSKIVLSFLLAVIWTSFLYPQSGIDPRSAAAQKTLEVYLDQADRAKTDAEWKSWAEKGLAAAQSGWENASVDPQAGSQSFPESNLRAEIESRFGTWLRARFFSQNDSTNMTGLWSEIEKGLKDLVFQKDADGNVLFDNVGDPLIKSLDGYDSDKAQYAQRLRTKIDDLLTNWENNLRGNIDGYSAGLTDADKAALVSNFDSDLAALKEAKSREFDKIRQMEEVRFASLRLNDQYSLKKKSDSEAADSVASTLIVQTKASIDEGLGRLVAGLSNLTDADVAASGLSSENWKKSFSDELDKGLAAWDEAERSLMVRRVEWEQQSGKDLAAGEQAWVKALESLSLERKKWVAQVDSILAQGRAKWQDSDNKIQAVIDQARSQLADQLQKEETNLSDRMTGLVSVLSQSVSMMNSARESWAYWMKKNDPNGNYTPTGVGYDIWSMRGRFAQQKMLAWFNDNKDQNGWLNSGDQFAGFFQDFFKTVVSQDPNVFDSSGNTLAGDSFYSKVVGEVQNGSINFNSAFQKYYGANQIYFDRQSSSVAETLVIPSFTPNQSYSGYGVYSNGVYLEYSIEEAIRRLKSKYPNSGNDFDGYTYTFNVLSSNTVSVTRTHRWKVAQDANAVKNIFLQTFQSKPADPYADGNEKNSSWEQAYYWMESPFTQYKTYAENARKDLAQTYGLVFFGQSGSTAWSQSAALSSLYTKLTTSTDNWEDLSLDDWQVELLKAKAVEGYWSRELEVAQAVDAYANDNSSLRDTEAQTLAKKDAALANYQNALTTYQSQVALLQSLTDAQGAHSQEMKTLVDTIGDLKNQLAARQEEYNKLLTYSTLGSTAIFQDQFRSSYARLLEIKGLSPHTGVKTLAESYADYLTLAGKMGLQTRLQSASSAVENLVNGDPEDQPPISLSSLQQQSSLISENHWADVLENPGAQTKDFVEKLQTLGVSETEAANLKLIYEAYQRSELPADQSKIEFLTKARNELLTLERSRQSQLDGRLESIWLVTASDANAWANKVTGATGANVSSLSQLQTFLKTQENLKFGQMIQNRLSVESNAVATLEASLQNWSGSGNPDLFGIDTPNESNWDNPQYFATVLWKLKISASAKTKSDALAQVASLKSQIASAKNALSSLDFNNASAIKATASQNEQAATYLKGGSLLYAGSVDLAASFLGNTYRSWQEVVQSQQALATLKNASPALRSLARDEALSKLSAYLVDKGALSVAADGTWNFTSARSIGQNRALVDFGAWADYLADLKTQGGILAQASAVGNDAQNAFDTWVNSLQNYAMSLRLGANASGNSAPASISADVKTRQSNLSEAYRDLGRLAQNLNDAARPDTSLIQLFAAYSQRSLETPASTLNELKTSTLAQVASNWLSVQVSTASGETDPWASLSTTLNDPQLATSLVAQIESLYPTLTPAERSTLTNDSIIQSLIAEIKSQFSEMKKIAGVPGESELSKATASAQFFDGVSPLDVEGAFHGQIAALKADAQQPIDVAKMLKDVVDEVIPVQGNASYMDAYVDPIVLRLTDPSNSFSSVIHALWDNTSVPDHPTFAAWKVLGLWSTLIDLLPNRLNGDTKQKIAMKIVNKVQADSTTNGWNDLNDTTLTSWEDWKSLGSSEEREGQLYLMDDAALLFHLKTTRVNGLWDSVTDSLLTKASASVQNSYAQFEASWTFGQDYLSQWDGSWKDYLVRKNVTDLSAENQSKLRNTSIYRQWLDGFWIAKAQDENGSPLDSTTLTGALAVWTNLGMSHGSDVLDEWKSRTSNFLTEGQKTLETQSSKAQIWADYCVYLDKANHSWRAYVGDQTLLPNGVTWYADATRTDFETKYGYDKYSVGSVDDAFDQPAQSAGGESSVKIGSNAGESDVIDSIGDYANAAQNLSTAIKTYKSEEIDAGSWWTNSKTNFTQQYAYLYNAGENSSVAYTAWSGADTALATDANKKYQDWQALIDEESAIKGKLAENGSVITLIAASAQGGASSEITETTAKIEAIKQSLVETEAQWKSMIGYRADLSQDAAQALFLSQYNAAANKKTWLSNATQYQLELLYNWFYGIGKNLYTSLQTAELEYKKQDAIFNYATSQYLKNDQADNSGTDDLAESLKQSLAAIDPANRLRSVRDSYNNASAVVDALTSMRSSNSAPANTDATYKTLMTRYQQSMRDKLALAKINETMNSAIAKKQEEVETAKKTLDSAYNAHYAVSLPDAGSSAFLEAQKADTTNGKLLSALKVTKVGTNYSITWDNSTDINDANYKATVAAYFNGDDSDFRKSLYDWMTRANSSSIDTWSMALMYERIIHDFGTAPTIDQLKTYFSSITNNPEKHLKDETYGMEDAFAQARNAYNSSVGTADYNSYKILSLSNGYKTQGQTFGLIEDKKLNAQAWQKMADSHQAQETSNWIAAGIMYGIAAGFVALAWCTFGASLIPAAIYAALGIMFTSFAGDQAGMKREAQHQHDEKISFVQSLESNFNQENKAILDAKKAWEDRSAELASMKTSSDHDPTTAELVAQIKASFAYTGNSLSDVRSLLGNSASSDDSAMLNALVGQYYVASASPRSKVDALIDMGKKASDTNSSALGDLNKYLYDGVTGKITVQKQKLDNWKTAVAAFQVKGIKPTNTLGVAYRNWKADLSNQSLSLDHARYYLGTLTSKNDNQVTLAEKTLSNLVTQFDDAQYLEERQTLQTQIVGTLSQILDGLALWDALQNAQSQVDFNAGVNERVVSLDRLQIPIDLGNSMNSKNAGPISTGLNDVFSELQSTLIDALHKKNAAILDVKTAELNQLMVDQNTQRTLWENQMSAIRARGLVAYQNAQVKIRAGQEAWKARFAAGYDEQLEKWNSRYQLLLTKKDAWVKALETQALQAQNLDMAKTLGTTVQTNIAEALDFQLDQLETTKTSEEIVNEALPNRNLLSQLLGTARTLTGGIGKITPVVFTSLKQTPYNSAQTVDSIRAFQTQNRDELEAHMAALQFDQAKEQLKGAKENLEEEIKGANQGFADGISGMFYADDFRLQGNRYVKNSLVKTTFSGGIYEEKSVAAYQNFTDASIGSLGQDMLEDQTAESLVALGSAGIDAAIQRAIGAVTAKREEIFGKEGEQPLYIKDWLEERKRMVERNEIETTVDNQGKSVSKVVKKWVEETYKVTQHDERTLTGSSATDFENSIGDNHEARVVRQDPGKFGEWVGYAPTFKTDAKPGQSAENNTLFAGKGESGRLIGWYQQFKIDEGAAYADLNKPAFDRPLWDDRGSWFKAVSLKSIVQTGVSIAASILVPGAGTLVSALAVAGINAGVDALFTGLAVAGGWESAGDAWGNWAVRSVASAATAVVGSVFSGTGINGFFKDGLMSKVGDNIIGKTLMTGVQGFTSNVVHSSISALSIHDGKWSYDASSVQEGVFGKNALAGYASSMASTLSSDLLGKINLKDGINNELTSNVFNTKSIRAFNNLAGSAIASAVDYGITGETSFNVLNFKDIAQLAGWDWAREADLDATGNVIKNADGSVSRTGDFISNGLLELHVGGSSGLSMNIGSGGYDISAGRISSSFSGLIDTLKISSAKLSSSFGDFRGISLLNTANMLGTSKDQFNVDLAKEVWSGTRKVNFTKLIPDENGMKQLGYVNPLDTSVINIDNSLLGNSDDQVAMLASVLSHEEVHARGVRTEANALMKGLLTYSELAMLHNIKGDMNFVNGQIEELLLGKNFLPNSGEKDKLEFKHDAPIASILGTLPDLGTVDVIPTGSNPQATDVENIVTALNIGFDLVGGIPAEEMSVFKQALLQAPGRSGDIAAILNSGDFGELAVNIAAAFGPDAIKELQSALRTGKRIKLFKDLSDNLPKKAITEFLDNEMSKSYQYILMKNGTDYVRRGKGLKDLIPAQSVDQIKELVRQNLLKNFDESSEVISERLETALSAIYPLGKDQLKELAIESIHSFSDDLNSKIMDQVKTLRNLDDYQAIQYLNNIENAFMMDFISDRSNLDPNIDFVPGRVSVELFGTKEFTQFFSKSDKVDRFGLWGVATYPFPTADNKYYTNPVDHLKDTLRRYKMKQILNGKYSYYFVNLD